MLQTVREIMKSITNVSNYRANKGQVKKWTKMPNETKSNGSRRQWLNRNIIQYSYS